MVDLGVPVGSTDSFGAGINSSGVVVGESWTTGKIVRPIRPIRWSEKNESQDLGSRDAPGARATAINDAGRIVGTLLSFSEDFDGLFAGGAVFWTDYGGVEDVAGCSNWPCGAAALAINSKGAVAGSSGGYGGSAFTWTNSSGIRYVKGLPLSSCCSAATGINDKESIVGLAYIANGPRAFVSSEAHGYTEIPSFPGRSSVRLTGINNKGQVVGFAQ